MVVVVVVVVVAVRCSFGGMYQLHQVFHGVTGGGTVTESDDMVVDPVLPSHHQDIHQTSSNIIKQSISHQIIMVHHHIY